MKDKEQTITDISIHVAALSASFKPAPDARHTTHWFTTDEVFDAIRRIDPGVQITKDQVHQAMHDAGGSGPVPEPARIRRLRLPLDAPGERNKIE